MGFLFSLAVRGDSVFDQRTDASMEQQVDPVSTTTTLTFHSYLFRECMRPFRSVLQQNHHTTVLLNTYGTVALIQYTTHQNILTEAKTQSFDIGAWDRRGTVRTATIILLEFGGWWIKSNQIPQILSPLSACAM